MVRYKKSCTLVVATRIQNEATCGFLQGTPWENKILRAIEARVEQLEAGGGGDEVVWDDKVILEVPPVVEVAPGGDEGSAVGRGSPASSRRSDCTSVSAMFQRCRERFQTDLDKLKANTTSAPDAKKLKASLLRTRLKDMAIRDIICNNGTGPDFLDLFGANAEDLLLWMMSRMAIS